MKEGPKQENHTHKETNPVIGGEFPFSEEMLDQPFRKSVLDMALQYHPDYHHYLTGGGYYSLKVILGHLQTKGMTEKPILLPSFLCPSILIPLRELNIRYEFYPVDLNLKINTIELGKKIRKLGSKVVLAIPYFGFECDQKSNEFLKTLKFSGVQLIEDRAQCLFPDFPPLGNYVFYSFRKFLPVDGSLLLSDELLEFSFEHNNGHYTALKKFGQQLRYRFLKHGEDTEEEFLKVFQQAEEAYYQNGIAEFEMTNLALFPRLNIEEEITQRRKCYRLLHRLLPEYALVAHRNTATASPLCFPIQVPGDRDQVQRLLKSERIFAPAHWRLSEEDVPASFIAAHRLSKSVLSLPLRTDLPEEAYHAMAQKVTELLETIH